MPLRRIKKHFPQPLSALLVISCSYLFCTTFCTTSYTLLTSCLRVLRLTTSGIVFHKTYTNKHGPK